MSLIEDHIHYVGGIDGMNTEAPILFHRWCFMSCVGALLGRQFTLQLGHEKLYTNLYTMLMGEPGTRKSTAIKQAKKLITAVGYKTFSAERTTKEKFFLDLVGHVDESEVKDKSFDAILDANMWNTDDIHEMFIVADEFNDFIGAGNIEFISILGSFWNYEGKYENRIKNGKSVVINNPTVSILGGNTPTNFAMAFPPEILGQGFFSRLLLIHGDATGKRIPFPEPLDPRLEGELISDLLWVKERIAGECEISPLAKSLLADIYCTWENHMDSRFTSYAQRRFSHLLKLVLIIAACNKRMKILEEDVIYGNTILSQAEKLMPKALGQYGRAKNADIAQVVLALLIDEARPMSLIEMWKILHVHFTKQADLAEVCVKLQSAGQIKPVVGAKYIPVRKEMKVDVNMEKFVNFELLTKEEQEYGI